MRSSRGPAGGPTPREAARPARAAARGRAPRQAGRRLRLLILIVAYNAERTIRDVLARIPAELGVHDTHVLIIDDASADRTFESGREALDAGGVPFDMTVLSNPVNQGYGGNQKIGFQYAIEEGFDLVALLHGDGQYAPECLPDLLRPLLDDQADAVFGSRMLVAGAARVGGMPLYKHVGNRVLSAFQNALLGTRLSEFHSGYRVYRVAALARIPFALNTGDFHFDTEIIIQLLGAGMRIEERPIPTYYGDEICHVNGLAYAWHVVCATVLARVQPWGVLYRRNFDVAPPGGESDHYTPKLGYASPHDMALARITDGDRVLELGCAGGYLSRAIAATGARVTGVDATPIDDPAAVGQEDFVRHDLDAGPPPVALDEFDVVLMLDVLEHLEAPERLLEELRGERGLRPRARLLASTGNVAFVVTRLMLLLGQFNYGKRGILDLDHKRLFTFGSFRRLFEQGGFEVLEAHGVPAPFPLALGDNRLARTLLAANRLAIRAWPSMFAYQVFVVVRPRPSLGQLLDGARRHSAKRASVGRAG